MFVYYIKGKFLAEVLAVVDAMFLSLHKQKCVYEFQRVIHTIAFAILLNISETIVFPVICHYLYRNANTILIVATRQYALLLGAQMFPK